MLQSCNDPEPQVETLDIEPLVEQKKYDEAISTLKKALTEFPKNTDLLYNLAAVEHMRRNINEALRITQRALNYAPNEDNLLLLASELHLENGHVEESLQFFNRLNEQTQQTARGQWLYGILHSHLRHWQQAEGCFRAAISLDESSSAAKAALALSLIRQNRIDEAKEILQNLEDQDQQSSETLHQMAECYLLLGNAEKAKSLAQQLVEERPNDAQVWSLMGRTEMILLNFGESESAFTRAIAAPNSIPWHKVQYAEMLFAAQREDEALAQALEVEEKLSQNDIQIHNPTLYNLLATLYARKGQILLARKFLNQSLLIDTNQPKVQQLIQQINQAEEGNLPEQTPPMDIPSATEEP